jgi:hypothetical protein
MDAGRAGSVHPSPGPSCTPMNHVCVPEHLSTPTETRHSRHLRPKLLITLCQSLSGSSNFPTSDPTKRNYEPDKNRRVADEQMKTVKENMNPTKG